MDDQYNLHPHPSWQQWIHNLGNLHNQQWVSDRLAEAPQLATPIPPAIITAITTPPPTPPPGTYVQIQDQDNAKWDAKIIDQNTFEIIFIDLSGYPHNTGVTRSIRQTHTVTPIKGSVDYYYYYKV